MYYYILDQGNLALERFERLQTELQGLLAEFKITGETVRVTPLRNIADLVDAASQRGAKTVVACGSDDSFNVMLAALKGRDFTVGFIPFDDHSNLAKILGIDSLFTGVKTIAARRIERMDLAKVSGNYFISFLEFGILSQNLRANSLFSNLKILSSEPKSYSFRVDNSYTVTITCLGGMVVNTRSTSCNSETIANPCDGFLDLLILEPLTKIQALRYKGAIASGCIEKVPKTTVIKCRSVQFLEPQGAALSVLGRVQTKFPATVEIIPQRLKMIVGKNRTF